MAGNELDYLEWIANTTKASRRIHLGPGDDMAIVSMGDSQLLMSSDMMLDGVHFDSNVHSWHAIGRKAVAACLSDCAAMAVNPRAVTLSTAFGNGMQLGDMLAVMNGAREIASQFDVDIAGGDTTSWDGRFAIDVAVVAEPFDGIRPVLRSGAQVGDRLLVTGKLGGSISGHHLQFTPRIEEARLLALRLSVQLHAMIDITDGLSLDLARMCGASGVGAAIDSNQLNSVISAAAREVSAQTGRDPQDHALHDGEDFELLFAVASDAEIPESLSVSPLGRIVDEGISIGTEESGFAPLEVKGYTH